LTGYPITIPEGNQQLFLSIVSIVFDPTPLLYNRLNRLRIKIAGTGLVNLSYAY
jgi:hypothetical protein